MKKTTYIIAVTIEDENDRGILYVSESYYAGSFSYIDSIKAARQFTTLEDAKRYKTSLETLSELEDVRTIFTIIKQDIEYTDALTNEPYEVVQIPVKVRY